MNKLYFLKVCGYKIKLIIFSSILCFSNILFAKNFTVYISNTDMSNQSSMTSFSTSSLSSGGGIKGIIVGNNQIAKIENNKSVRVIDRVEGYKSNYNTKEYSKSDYADKISDLQGEITENQQSQQNIINEINYAKKNNEDTSDLDAQLSDLKNQMSVLKAKEKAYTSRETNNMTKESSGSSSYGSVEFSYKNLKNGIYIIPREISDNKVELSIFIVKSNINFNSDSQQNTTKSKLDINIGQWTQIYGTSTSSSRYNSYSTQSLSNDNNNIWIKIE